MRNGVANNMLNWIQSYLFNRRARVSLDQLSSRKILLRQGVPQGGVISPTLFLVFINDLVSELKAALYADDLVLWCKKEHASTATTGFNKPLTNLQPGLRIGVSLSTRTKPSTTLFTLSPKKQARRIKIGTHTLKEKDQATYLGVTFDKRLTWKTRTLRT